MTAPHRGPTLEAPDLDAALGALRQRGLRVSASRRITLEALYAADEPLTAEQLAARVGDLAPADVASVYRNLDTLESVGLVRHFHLGHGPGLYARAGSGAREYLVCDSCRTVRALEPHELDGVRERVRDEFGFEATFTHYPIVGLCRSCRQG
jgi:Fur family ferric uptake transcriptional regulator